METFLSLVSACTLLQPQPQPLGQPCIANKTDVKIVDLCKQLCREFENSPETTIGSSDRADQFRPLLSSICEPCLHADTRFLITKVLKILLRKELNRSGLGKAGVTAIVKSLSLCGATPALTAEACNLVLNALYDGRNVQYFVEADGVSVLFALLQSPQERVQASALGAIQGVCFVPSGRHHIRSCRQNIELLCRLMLAGDGAVRARALGSVHNLSVDIQSIVTILEIGESVPAIVSLLRDSAPEVCQVACGTLQNLSRDPHGRHIISTETAAVSHLTDLLCSTSLSCQVAAVGALWNIMNSSSSSEEEKKILQRMLTDGVVLGAIRSCVFDEDS